MSSALVRRLLTVEEYHRIGELGILQGQSLELINGEILEMSPVGSDHASIVEKLKDLLTIKLYQQAIVRVQNPIHLSRYSEPEPDLAIVQYRDDYYRKAHPTPSDTVAVIEVADTSLAYDLEVKLPLYAQHEIKEFWLINISQQQLEVYTHPADGTYKMRQIYNNDDIVTLSEFDLEIKVRDLL